MAETTMNRLYYSLSEPSAFSSAARLLKAVRQFHPRVTRSKVEAWLRRQDTYTLHRQASRKLRAEPRVYAKHIDDQWCVDLCDMNNIAQYNDGCRYILTCIDVLSKFAWAENVKSKAGKAVASAMERILLSTTRRPKRIQSDKGTEFYNPHFRELLAKNGAKHFSSNSRHKASVVERFNRSLKNIIYKSFTTRQSYNWISILNDVLGVYNNRYHRSIGCKPADVNTSNEKVIWRRLYSIKPPTGKLLKRGQLVRISKIKRQFEKGYLPNYTEEIFRIEKVHLGTPHQYKLEDLLGESIKGKFVAEELSLVDKDIDEVWKIEEVIKRDKRGRYFVKWLGFPTKFNSWVNSIQIL